MVSTEDDQDDIEEEDHEEGRIRGKRTSHTTSLRPPPVRKTRSKVQAEVDMTKNMDEWTVYPHRYYNPIWTSNTPIGEEIQKGDKGTSPPQSAYNIWHLYTDYLPISKDNTAPENVRLTDWHVWKVVQAKGPGKPGVPAGQPISFMCL